MKLFAPAALVLALALPARAAEAPPKADFEIVSACLALVKENQNKAGPTKDEKPGAANRLATAAREAPREPASCISVLYAACVAKEGDIDHTRAECADRETKVWDQRLNDAYRKALDHMEKEGAENLRKTQRAWIVLRDARCGQAWATWQGTMAGPAQSWCEMEMTARQALWMAAWNE
jgi:uncharacterized protein YecT (DUF1311 family)